MDNPRDPIAAVTHRDPYSYYRRLAADQPFAFHSSIGTWVAAGEMAIRRVLANPACRVRPQQEAVPKAFQGTPVGRIFEELARTTEGGLHERARSEVTQRISAWNTNRIATAAEEIWPQIPDLPALLWRFPSCVLARLLGFPVGDVMEIAGEAETVALAISPGADLTKRLAPANAAAEQLWARFSGPALERANAIGVLSQAFEATGAWIGNTLVALHGHQIPAREIQAFVERVAQVNPAVHNTRRFVDSEAMIEGARVAAGSVIVVILVSCGFGGGRHQCVGRALSGMIVAEAVGRVGGSIHVPAVVRYRPSLNIRIPEF